MFYIIVISCWFASASDDRICVYLEQSQSPEDAKQQARERLSIEDEQIFSIEAKPVNAQNVGLVFMED